jgi:hypothetical protein
MKTIILKEIKCSVIECDRCHKEVPNHPYYVGKFHPSQVKNPDGRLGFYFICMDCITR